MDRPRYKVLILVKHGLYDPFIELAKSAQGETFLSENHGPNIRVIHYYGVPVRRLTQKIDALHEKLRWANRTTNIFLRVLDMFLLAPFMLYMPKVIPAKILQLPDEEYQCIIPDTLPSLRWKQLAIYNYVLKNYDFDFVFDTNESSYIDYKNLLLQVLEFKDEFLYAGNVPFGNFVSGANRFFSRRALELLVHNKVYWNPAYLEDLGIGKVMAKLGVPITVTQSHTISHPDVVQQIGVSTLQNNYHFRAKCLEGGRRLDSLIMIRLQKRFQNLREISH